MQLLERHPLGLSVVGEDDEVVVARRPSRHLLDDVQNLVERLEDLECLEPIPSRMMRDLVVVDEVDVDALAPSIMCRPTRAMFRSRSTPLLTARSTANVHDRWTRGTTSRRRWERAWNRSFTTSTVVRVMLLANPSGRSTNLATAWRVSTDPRASFILLIVSMLVTASPENRLEMDTPSSARRPDPLLARSSMMVASAGRLATSTRPSSRSYHRKAGTPWQVPCRMPCWLAGVVHGSWTVHSLRRWDPVSTHRRRVGIVPDCSAHCATGNGRPSSCTNTTPSTSGSGTSALFRPNPRRAAVKASSVPAVASQVRKVPTVAAIHVAATSVQKDVTSMPGTTRIVRCITTACPVIASRPTAHQPIAPATVVSTGRSRKPNRPVTAAAATSLQGELACMPGSSWSAITSATELIAHDKAMRARSETRSLTCMLPVSGDRRSRCVTHRG